MRFPELRFDDGDELVHLVRWAPSEHVFGHTWCDLPFTYDRHLEAPTSFWASGVYDVPTCLRYIASCGGRI